MPCLSMMRPYASVPPHNTGVRKAELYATPPSCRRNGCRSTTRDTLPSALSRPYQLVTMRHFVLMPVYTFIMHTTYILPALPDAFVRLPTWSLCRLRHKAFMPSDTTRMLMSSAFSSVFSARCLFHDIQRDTVDFFCRATAEPRQP